MKPSKEKFREMVNDIDELKKKMAHIEKMVENLVDLEKRLVNI
jgi:hypothetical protein